MNAIPVKKYNIPKSFNVTGSIKYSKTDFYFKMQLVLFQELRFVVFLPCTRCLPPGSETPNNPHKGAADFPLPCTEEITKGKNSQKSVVY